MATENNLEKRVEDLERKVDLILKFIEQQAQFNTSQIEINQQVCDFIDLMKFDQRRTTGR